MFENHDLKVSVRTLKNGDEVLFHAKDVAAALGYKNPRKAVWDHVWDKDKTNLKEFQRGSLADPPLNCQPNTVLINEQGVYQLIFGSELKRAKEFRRWVFKEVLPSIRKTGTYTVPKPKPLEGMQIRLLNETDLHYKVVEYIRWYHPVAFIIAGLGEFQTTYALRMDGWHKGYTSGQPDIIIANPMNEHNGFAIELKTPKGNGWIKDNQHKVRERLDDLGYKTMISNDYTEIILEIHKYFQVDTTKVYKNEIKQLKRKCTALKRELTQLNVFTVQCSEVNTKLRIQPKQPPLTLTIKI
jgi:prophage antirepressor-like protein